MSGGTRTEFKNPVVNWIDERLPVFTLIQKEFGVFQTPKNFNYLWIFGAVASLLLVMMIITGIVLAMHYTPQADMAFGSMERIMRDVNWGWLLRNLHMNGASFFFAAIYIHMFRNMYYGSYKKPRELLWIFGVVIYVLMMATAFMGYVLPWSQMGGWAATVITNLFSAIPFVGDYIVTLLWGGFSVDNPTLNRFFSLHYLLPFVIFAMVFLHIWSLHIVGSNNPTGVEPKSKEDTVPFHPYYTMKDLFGFLVCMVLFVLVAFYTPNMFAHPDHFKEFNSMVTPPHIVPEWYFLPFYAMLKSVNFNIGIPFTEIVLIPAKLGGVIAMFGSILVLFVLPWLDTQKVRSARYRPVYRNALWGFVLSFVLLGYVGAQSPEGIWLVLGQVGMAYYYAFFLVILPWLSKKEKTLPLPKSISDDVLNEKQGAA